MKINSNDYLDNNNKKLNQYNDIIIEENNCNNSFIEPRSKKKVVFDKDGNFLKSFDYLEEIYKNEKNYTQANYEINYSDINNNYSMNDNTITTNSQKRLNNNNNDIFIRNDYSQKSYLSNEKINPNNSFKNLNKLPSVINKNIVKHMNSINDSDNKKFNKNKIENRNIINQKLEKITNNHNFNNQKYRTSNNNDINSNTIITNHSKLYSNSDTILQPLDPLNNGTLSSRLERKKKSNTNSVIKNKNHESINLISINNMSPQLIYNKNSYNYNISKPNTFNSNKFNTLLTNFKKDDILMNDFSLYDYSINTSSTINDNKINHIINKTNNNNINNNNKKILQEKMPIIDINHDKKIQNQSISQNSIMYLKNEEANTKSKNNFKSWVIINFAHEWENQPWISIKCPTYDELEKDKEQEIILNYHHNKNSNSYSIIETLPLKIAYLSQTIQHIYRNSSKFNIYIYNIKFLKYLIN